MRPAALEGLLDEGADGDDLGAGGAGETDEAENRGAAGEEVVDDEHALAAREVLGRHHEIDSVPLVCEGAVVRNTISGIVMGLCLRA